MAVFGGVGIFLLRGGASLEAAALAGGLAALVALGSVAALLWRWLAKHSEDEQHLSEEFLQGLPVRVARAVDACDGEVEYADGGITRRVAARALGGSRYGEGDEVVIDHRKDGVVYVEAWSRVEERL
jgi:membrane protein implicated in regulation of membrane protease activity